MAPNNANLWHTIGVAADVAGVARRSAFRWAARGALPVHKIGQRRYVEVGALRRFAANRGNRAIVAPGQATKPSEVGGPPPQDEETLDALSEGLTAAQEMVQALFSRVERLERLLGARSR